MNPQDSNEQPSYTSGAPQNDQGLTTGATQVPNYASTVTENYGLESLEQPLEVHDTEQPGVQPQQSPHHFLSSSIFSRRKAVIVSTLITALVLLLTLVAMASLVRRGPADKQQSAQTSEQKDVKIEGAIDSTIPEEFQGAEESLLVSGDLVTRGSLKISSGGYVTVIRVQNPTANQTVTLPSGSGTFCLDSNNCGYAAVAELAAAQDQLTTLQGEVSSMATLLSELETNTPSAGVDNLNGQRGAVSIQGSLNRINVSTSGGVVTLTTPQDLDSNANVQFGNLTVSPTGQIAANTLVQTGAGNSININANNDMITFTAGGRIFQLPNSGPIGGTQTICTTGASCASGGGTAVLLADGAVQTDGSGNASIYINDTGGGNLLQLQSGGVDRLTVANSGNTTVSGSLTVSSLGSGFVRSTAGALSVVSSINLASADVTGTLAVSNGGTGLNTIPANGVLVGNGTSPVSSVSAGGAGLCLVSTAGAPSFQACPGSGTSFNLDADSGTAEQLNGGDTITIAGGNNVTTSVSATDTVTVGTVNNPSFTTSVTTPLLQSSGALSITPGGALTVGATGQSALLQGSTTTITSNGAGNDIVLTSADQIRLSGFNCAALGNGGKLTTDASGNVSCAADNGGSGAAITGSGNGNRLALFTGAQTIADSWLLQNGSTLELDNTRNLSLTGGNFTVSGTGTFSGLLTANGDIYVGGDATFNGGLSVFNTDVTIGPSYTLTFNGETFTDLTGTGLTLSSGSLQTTLGTSVDLTSEVTGVLPVTNGGTGVNGSAAANGQLLVGNGSGYTLATISQGAGITITNGAGSITVASTLGVAIDSSEITDLTITNADIANGTISLSNKTTGNYVATVADSGSNVISVSGSGSNNAAVTLGLVADSIGDTQLAFNTGQNLTTASTPSFTGLNVTGGTFTVGTTSQLASLLLHDGNGQTTTLRPGDSAGNLTFVLPVADGTANQCIKTNASGALSFGDCVASIGGGGGITGSGTQNRLSKFGAGGTSVTDSTITDNGTSVTTSVDLVVQGGDFTLGTALQNAALTMYGNGFAANITTATLTGAQNYTLPDGSGEFCIKELGNCSGAGGGNAPSDAQYLTLALNGGLSAERTLSFNGTNFSVVDNGANGSYSVNTAQNINTAATPSFAGLTLTGNMQLNANTLQGGAAVIDFTSFDVANNGNVTAGTYNGQTISSTASLSGTLAVAGLTTLNGGLTIDPGDTLTFNGDAFTDLTGNGLQVSSNALTILVQASKGLEVDNNGLSLIDCATGEVLKYNVTNQWVCGTDSGSGGLGDDVQVNGVAADGANFINTTASGTTAGVTWSLNNVASPDEISLTVSNASDTVAGVVTTGSQTFAGNKTFNGSVVLAASQSITVTGGNTASRPGSPTEGMVYYDTDTDRLMVYSNGKWQADRADAIIVAASNSSQADKDAADFVADGNTGAAADGDQIQINAAITAASGKKVILLAGTYVADATILIPNNTTLAGVGNGTLVELADLDASDNLIENSDSSTGTGVTIRDMKLDGRKDLNTLGTQHGIYLNGMGDATTPRQGARITNVKLSNFRNTSIYLNNSDNIAILGIRTQGNDEGILLNASTHNTISGGSSDGDDYGITLEPGSTNNSIANNIIQNSSNIGIYIWNTANYNTINGNTTSSSGDTGIMAFGSASNTISGNTSHSNGSYGISINSGVTSTIITGNTTYNNATAGIYIADNTTTGNSITSNTHREESIGVYLDNAVNNSIATNTISDSLDIGILLSSGNGNSITGNRIHNSGGATVNDAIILQFSDTNTITGNAITDTSATSNNYAISINDAGSASNYLGGNTLGTGSINDLGTGTIYGGQVNSAGNYLIQPAGTIELMKNTNITGTLSITSNVDTNGSLTVGSADQFIISNAGVVTSGTWQGTAVADTYVANDLTISTSGNVDWQALSNYPAACGAGNAITALGDSVTCSAFAAGSGSGNYIQNQNASQQSSSNFWISGSGRADTSFTTPLLDTATAVALNIGTTNATQINLNKNVIVAASQSLTITGGNTASRPGSPTEGMVYYDTDTDRLMVYSNGKWQADRTDAVLVAASNSSQADKDAADYVADGNTGAAADGDQVQINAALTAASGKKVVLLAGTYVADATILIPNNTTLAGVGKGTLIELADIDASDNLIEATGSSRTGQDLRDMRIDGRNDLNTAGTQYGVYFSSVGASSPFRVGSTISNVHVTRFRTYNFVLTSSVNTTLINSTAQSSGSYGIFVTGSNNTFIGNTVAGNSGNGFYIINSSDNTFTNNNIYSNTGSAFLLDGSSNNILTNNSSKSNTGAGIQLTNLSDNNIVSNNRIDDSAGSTTNNGVIVADSDSNTITSNVISDGTGTTNCSTTCYAISISNSTSDTNYLADNTLGNGTINNTGTGTIFGGQVNSSGNFVVQPAGTIELVANTNITGTLNITSNVDTNGSLTVGNANQFVISNTGVVTSGTWQGNTIGLAYGGTNNNTYTTNGILYNNGSALVSTGAGTTGQCLIATTGSAPSWTSCTATTLQGAYTASSTAPTAAEITLTDNKNLQFTAADTGTDPSIIMKLNCTACGTGTAGNFLIQSATPDTLFSVAGNGSIQIGGGNGAGSFGYISLSGSGGETTGSFTLNGTARNAKTIRLSAEYPSAVLDTGGTGANTGTMTSGNEATDRRKSYYNWTTTQTSNHNYDIVVQVPIPNDFDGWNGATPLTINGWTANTTDGSVKVEVIKSNGSVDTNFSTFPAMTIGSASTWTSQSFGLDSSNYTAGDYMTLRIRLTAKQTSVRAGNITINYLSKF